MTAALGGVDVGSAFTNWEIYLVVGLGVTALVISQSAYQAGPLALSMPAIAIVEPTVSGVIGDSAFHEQTNLSGGPLVLELIAALVAAAGLFVLATFPTVLVIYDQQPETTAPTRFARTATARTAPDPVVQDRMPTVLSPTAMSGKAHSGGRLASTYHLRDRC